MSAVGPCHAVRLDSGPRSQEDVEVQGQRRGAERADREVRADAVRYWAAAARLGLDATYDIGQMKIGRRLAIKLLNATKFALAIGREDENHHVGAAAETSWNPADVTEPLDRAAMAKLAVVVRQATEALEAYEHSKALETIESYFWQFCDDYIELVKNRAYGTPDEHGNVPSEKAVKSARTALGLGLDASHVCWPRTCRTPPRKCGAGCTPVPVPCIAPPGRSWTRMSRPPPVLPPSC